MMSNRSYSFGIVLALSTMATAGNPAEAIAQGSRESENATLRADCRLASQALVTGRPEPLFDWAMGHIGRCDDTAGEALPVLLRRASSDSADLDQLFLASKRIRDQRILVAALEVARNTAAHWRPRVMALHLMANYIDPSTLFSPYDLTANPDGTVQVSSASHWVQRAGSQALDVGAPVQIAAVLRELGDRDADVRVRASARYFGKWLANNVAPPE
jgi:hypothetical protein